MGCRLLVNCLTCVFGAGIITRMVALRGGLLRSVIWEKKFRITEGGEERQNRN